MGVGSSLETIKQPHYRIEIFKKLPSTFCLLLPLRISEVILTIAPISFAPKTVKL